LFLIKKFAFELSSLIVCEVPLPPPGKVQVKFGFTIHDSWTIERPPENQLPMANFSYRPIFTCLSIPNILVVVGCLLQETRVALISKHYALLTPVSEALLSMLFPLHWQGMYLPILPYSMLEILDAPVPYLVGLHSRYMNEVPVEKRPNGVVIVDLDRDEVHLGYDDQSDADHRLLPSLPDRHAMKLRAKLLEFAAGAYIVPNTQRIGFVSTGYGIEVPSINREPYAQTHDVPSNNSLRRRDVLPQTDKAFGDNDLLVPLSGFLSEQGQLYQQQEKQVESLDRKTPKFQLKINRLLKSTSDSPASTSLEREDLTDRDVENILDMKEVRKIVDPFFGALYPTFFSSMPFS
jgi:DENN (AEX-3) domain